MNNNNLKINQIKEIQKKSTILFSKMNSLKKNCNKISQEEIDRKLIEIKRLESEILSLRDKIIK